jgi:hypothetical protein
LLEPDSSCTHRRLTSNRPPTSDAMSSALTSAQHLDALLLSCLCCCMGFECWHVSFSLAGATMMSGTKSAACSAAAAKRPSTRSFTSAAAGATAAGAGFTPIACQQAAAVVAA